jgi:rhamnogalacturonyl hydrolase YesR
MKLEIDSIINSLLSFLGDQSCCFWGRGNGWAFMAYTELLEAWQFMGLGKFHKKEHKHLLNKQTHIIL